MVYAKAKFALAQVWATMQLGTRWEVWPKHEAPFLVQICSGAVQVPSGWCQLMTCCRYHASQGLVAQMCSGGARPLRVGQGGSPPLL